MGYARNDPVGTVRETSLGNADAIYMYAAEQVNVITWTG